MHRVYPTAPSMDASATDSGTSGDLVLAGAPADAPAALQEPGSHPSSLLILVSACHIVLAVVLTAYDEDIEEAAGGCFGLQGGN